MNYKNFFSRKDALSKLNLSAIKYCVLGDMKRVISELKNNFSKDENCNFMLPLFENNHEKCFDNFLVKLGPNRAKQLISLFRKIKTRISDSLFETEVLLLYLCIEDEDMCLANLLYCGGEDNCFDCMGSDLDQQFKNIIRTLISTLEDFGIFV